MYLDSSAEFFPSHNVLPKVSLTETGNIVNQGATPFSESVRNRVKATLLAIRKPAGAAIATAVALTGATLYPHVPLGPETVSHLAGAIGGVGAGLMAGKERKTIGGKIVSAVAGGAVGLAASAVTGEVTGSHTAGGAVGLADEAIIPGAVLAMNKMRGRSK